ncbi:hypothetical protein [Mycobacteroides abscessus]|uniref:Uncharacterized protein n=1 Tax=Mycobacteroides abscessus subsp. massiliense TaxID=1962118 RepID=A0A1U4SK33_9MYCO|nr:hypothetical protein [Mycobacteroides abscessus]AMU67695.1 hypothetical protein A3O04_22285 [Mycobacteroides abscessus]ANO16233.1 hypothetical protein BAB77_22115 [Mycobacteroides abscessus]ARQ66567.1 hypothetical protein CAK77_22440 [Mycobacteroides abscessus subsp. massiliense]EIV65683.1 hypothetical protein MMCCUG48898_4601 [Mycobacteroides abscessus subsp. massiliense CCUG 48898 = JCM 15300]MBE5406795.1 hypothetical protein [Mycobacteroides abscessus]
MTQEAQRTEDAAFFAALGKLIGQYLGGTITARIYARDFMSLRSRFITDAAVDDPTARDMFTDLEDYVPAYQPPDPAEVHAISEAEMRRRLIEERVPALEERYGKIVALVSPDPEYLTKQHDLACRINDLSSAYAHGAISGEDFIAGIYGVQDIGDQWQIFHDLFDTSYADAAELEMGSPDIGSDAYGRDSRMLAADRSQALESAFGLTSD